MSDREGSDLSWARADMAVAGAVADRHDALGRPILVGLAGAQGSGKSTMAPRLAALLEVRKLRTAILVLDDFYLTGAERALLAREIHPLLATRGAPGTHDVAMLGEAVEALLAGRSVEVPRFDKASDDREGSVTVTSPVDVVLLEGWCIGARPQSTSDLAEPLNALEAAEDPDGMWRRWVNDRLASEYAALFERLDLRILLRAPGFAIVHRWRSEQEADLVTPSMDASGIARFIQHFERITRAMLADEPADLVIGLDPSRIPAGTRRPLDR